MKNKYAKLEAKEYFLIVIRLLCILAVILGTGFGVMTFIDVLDHTMPTHPMFVIIMATFMFFCWVIICMGCASWIGVVSEKILEPIGEKQ